MRRRTFIASVAAALVAPWRALAPSAPAAHTLTGEGGFQSITWNGRPFVFDRHTTSQIYFMSADGPWVVGSDGARRV